MTAIGSRGEDLRSQLELEFPRGLAKWDRFMLTLNAYFDDSGTHESSDAIVVAGYISTAEQWSSFNDEWLAALAEWDLAFFHMTDFATGAGQYALWTDLQKRDRFARLALIIRRHTLASISAGFLRKAYNQTFDKQTKRYIGGPYTLATTMCFLDAAERLNPLYPSARIAYVFEDGSKGKGNVLSLFDMNKSNDDNRDYLKLLSIGFKDKRDFPPLQAADILAYEQYRYIPQVAMSRDYPVRQELRQLVPDEESSAIKCWGWVDDAELLKFASVLNAAFVYHGRKSLREVAHALQKADKQRKADYVANGRSVEWARIVSKHLTEHFRYHRAAKVDSAAIKDYVESRHKDKRLKEPPLPRVPDEH